MEITESEPSTGRKRGRDEDSAPESEINVESYQSLPLGKIGLHEFPFSVSNLTSNLFFEPLIDFYEWGMRRGEFNVQ